MTLHKHTSLVARAAVFHEAQVPEQAPVAEEVAKAKPDPKDLEIEALGRENEGLRIELAQIKDNFQLEVARARASARAEAASTHIRNDEEAVAALIDALQQAHEVFRQESIEATSAVARSLAGAALKRIVEPCEGDLEFLARVIDARLATLDRSAVIGLQLGSSDHAEALARCTVGRLPHGTQLTVESRLAPGTARIVLGLGAVDIDLGRGLLRLLKTLEEGDHG